MSIPGKILLLLLLSFPVMAGPLPYRGSFLMSFTESQPSQKKLWPFEWSVDVTRMGMEIKDDQNKKGVSKRILYNLADSTWLMIMHYNKVKQATRIHANAMFRDTMKSPEVKVRATRATKEIGGYTCRKYIAESVSDSAVLWITTEINFDLCRLYKMLCHCGMMSGLVDSGNWYFAQNIKGMILEASSTDRKTGMSYTVQITEIRPDVIHPAYFNLTGFRISDIPEGASCGPMTKE